MRRLWRLLAEHRDYRLLVTAGLVSGLGDHVLAVGLTFLVYDLTGSTLASAGMLIVSVLPQVVLASPAGVLVDRWDRRRTVTITYLVHAVGLLPLLLVSGSGRLWIMYAVAAGQAVLEQLSVPAEQALVPHLVGADELVSANAVNSQVRNLARLVGSGLGGVAAAVGGLAAISLIDASSFVAAAVLVALIRSRVAHARLADPELDSVAREPWWREWRAGLSLAMADRTLRILLLFALITSVGEGVMGTLFAPFVRDVLHGGPQDYGLISGIQAVGGILGGLALAAYGGRWAPRPLLGWGAVAFGLIDLVLFLYPIVYVAVGPALVCMVIVGFPGAAVVATFMTLAQSSTDDAFRGRVFGTVLGLEATGLLVGSLAAGWLAGPLGVVPVIAWQGVGYTLLGILVLMTLARDEDAPGPASEPVAVPTVG
ncbi:MAG: hypothetical protein QOE01_321 [Actinomycetota bacterium]|nr:hypothetical protein [Actinomycetota bacterium]